LLLMTAPSPKDALWVTEEALKCAGVAGVALELSGPLDLAASRRLQLAAETGGGLGLILRAARAPGASVARTRWRVSAAPSAVPAWAARLAGLKPPGAPRWRVALTRSVQDSETLVEWRHATRGFHLVAGLADGASAPGRSERAA
jgi:protein ImuA